MKVSSKRFVNGKEPPSGKKLGKGSVEQAERIAKTRPAAGATSKAAKPSGKMFGKRK